MSLSNIGEKAYLLLENGTVFEGRSFGAKGTVFGEAVFCTSAVGYQQMLTDPGYYGQLLVQTFPQSGNYGVNNFDDESKKAHLSGYIVREWCDTPSNFRCTDNIDSFMKKLNIVGIAGIDTRALTRALRDNGSLRGAITTEDVFAKKEEILGQIAGFKIEGAVKAVSCTEKTQYMAQNPVCSIAAYDFGIKQSSINALCALGCNVTVYPANTALSEVLATKPDGIYLSEGGGDPRENGEIIDQLKGLLTANIETLGVSLGGQLMALAAGCQTKKMPQGHHGANHAAKDIKTGRVYVTVQNHCYDICTASVGEEIACPSHINVVDGTYEGIAYKCAPILTVQFCPDYSGSKLDTSYILEEFVSRVCKQAQK